LAGTDPHVGEELRCLGPADAREQTKPLVSLASTADDVALDGPRLLGERGRCRSMIDDPAARAGVAY
jgi:hypothetical protein